jgi:uncharacterized protein (DUF169 family)
MLHLEACREAGEQLLQSLRTKSYPFAVRLLRAGEPVPAGLLRPIRDLGHHLSLCQAYQMARRDGAHLALRGRDMWCFEPVVGYGLGEPPARFLAGSNRYPHDVRSPEAGRTYAEQFPRLPAGLFEGVLAAPLHETPFVPDAVVVYCDTAQLNLLLLAREAGDGSNLPCALSGHAACVYAVVPALQQGRCHVAVPCRGDRYAAMAGDDEMIFTIPAARLGQVLDGLRYVERSGSRLPHGYRVRPEYPLSDSYREMAEAMGYR